MFQPFRCLAPYLFRQPSKDLRPRRIDADPDTIGGCDTKHVSTDLPDPVSLLRPLRDALFEAGIQIVKRFLGRVPLGDVAQDGGHEYPPVAQPARSRYVEESARSILASCDQF